MKKGFILPATLLSVIAATAITIMLLFFVNAVVEGLKADAPIQACKLSVATSAFAKDFTEAMVDVGVSCPRTRVIFKDEGAREISEKLGNEMFLCAERFYHGKLDFVKLNKLFSADKATCLICATVNTERTAVDLYKKEGKSLTEHLDEIKFPIMRMNYGPYFKMENEKADKLVGDIRYITPETLGSRFDPEKTNVIIFAHLPERTVASRWREKAEEIPYFGEVVNWVYKQRKHPDEVRSIVLLAPADAALTMCDNIIN